MRAAHLAARTADVAAAPPAGSESPDGSAGGQRAVQSVEVGGRLLLALAAHPAPMALKDLAAAAGLPASRAHPYLVSFGKLGLVEQQRDGGRYALGPAALQIGLAALHQLDPLRAAEPVAQHLAASTGYAVALALWGSFGPTVVRMFEAREPLLVAMRTGTVMSVLHTATGRAFAGALPQAAVEHALAGALGDAPLEPRPLDAAQQAIVRQARADLAAHGVVRADGRPIPSVNAFSAPAFDHEGRTAIVITALGHQDAFPVAWDSPAAQAVREAAAAISHRLGHGAAPAR